MIKGITLTRAARSAAESDLLAGFYAALGFEPGHAWEKHGARGTPFRAPVGEIEILTGPVELPADTLIEVTQIDDLHLLASGWLAARGHGSGDGISGDDIPGDGISATHISAIRISPIEDTAWNSRLFTVEPVAGHTLAFWESNDPFRGAPHATEGDLSAAGMRFAIVVARWNAVITDRLLQGALDALLRSGAERGSLEIVRVPGAWEVPSAARALAESRRFDGVVTLGCLIRGETAHYEAIYNEVSRAIGQCQADTGVPHGFGVLTCETLEQALNRAGIKAGNKGFEAAVATIEMVSLHRKLAAGSGDGKRA